MNTPCKAFWVAAAIAVHSWEASHPAAALDPTAEPLPNIEERIAQLEAEVALGRGKPGSVRITGLVHFGLLFWDDGHERESYFVTNDNVASRLVVSSSVALTQDWKVGYYVDLGMFTADTSLISQKSDDFDEVRLRYTFGYLESEQWGRFTFGRRGGASSDIAGVNFSVTGEVFAFYAQANTGNTMFLRTADGRLSDTTWGTLRRNNGTAPGEGFRAEVVRYDSPAVAGFRATATWGEDDYWDIGLRYTGKLHDLKLDVFAIYGVNSENGNNSGLSCLANSDQLPLSRRDAHCNHAIGVMSAMHEPSGLYANFALGRFHDDLILQTTAFAGTGADDNNDFWAAEIGIARQWFDIGKTTIFGQHFQFHGGANARLFVDAADAANPFGVTSRRFDSGMHSWSGGIVQNISEANMDFYVLYRRMQSSGHFKEGVSGAGALADAEFEPFQYILTGAVIRF